jgi:hypothetical protein
MRRKLAIVLVLVAALGVATPAVAVQTISQDGTTLDSTDQTTTSVIGVESNGTVTVQFTGIGATGDYPTNVTAKNATIDSGTVTVNDGNVSVGGSPTSATMNVTFDYAEDMPSNGTVPDYIDTTNTSNTTLIESPDGSEVQYVDVVNSFNFVNVSISSTNGEFNQTTNEYDPNSTGEEAQFVVDFEKKDTVPYEVQNLSYEFGLNNVQFDEISLETETNATDGVVLKNIAEENNTKVYTLQVQNLSKSQTIKINATPQSGGENDSIVHGPVVDPKGGQPIDYNKNVALATSGGLGPLALGTGVGSVLLGIIGGAVVLYFIYLFMMEGDVNSTLAAAVSPMNLAGLVVVIVGLTMGADFLLADASGWSQLLPDSVPDFTTAVVGIVLVAAPFGFDLVE